MKPGGVTYCPRCRKVFIAFVDIEKLEPWETPAPPGAEVDELTTCPKCGCETQVLQLTDEVRDALRANEEPPAHD